MVSLTNIPLSSQFSLRNCDLSNCSCARICVWLSVSYRGNEHWAGGRVPGGGRGNAFIRIILPFQSTASFLSLPVLHFLPGIISPEPLPAVVNFLAVILSRPEQGSQRGGIPDINQHTVK
jgi:hypothetical protein